MAVEPGRVAAIYLAESRGAPTRPVSAVAAVAGVGLRGDWHAQAGDQPPWRQLTLIEAEAIEAANREHGLSLGLGDTRRNVVTRGVRLNDLVGREFTVGGVHVRGVKLCEPCKSLERLTGQPVLRALVHRGGLYAEILSSGTLRVEDEVSLPPSRGVAGSRAGVAAERGR